jgi:hypothetical protein
MVMLAHGSPKRLLLVEDEVTLAEAVRGAGYRLGPGGG